MKTIMILALLGVAACGAPVTAPPDPYVVASGSYKLLRVNDRLLPSALFNDGTGRQPIIVITGGVIVIRPDHSYTKSLTFKKTVAGYAPVDGSSVENGSFGLITGTTMISFRAPPQNGDAEHLFEGDVADGVLAYSDGVYGVDGYWWQR